MLSIDGLSLTIEDVAAVARPAHGRSVEVRLSEEARAKLADVRTFMTANWMTDDAPLIYSFNTGAGPFRDRRVLVSDMAEAQRRGILSHATGMGDPFAEDTTRAMMLLRANSIAANYSGARPEVIDLILKFLNAGLHPVVPQQGSVGASGDLAPLAHMTAAILGYQGSEIVYRGRRMPAAEAIGLAGFDPAFPLQPKDSSSLMNGSTTSLAVIALAVHDMARLLKTADIALALTMEALRAEKAAFDARLHRARPHVGQATVARNILKIVGDSSRCSQDARSVVFPDEARSPGAPAPQRVQDVYSVRCAPQVHGPAREALAYARGIVDVELNSSTDNPLVIAEAEGYVALSGGHFHGQYLAQAADLLGIALADLGAISERRMARLIDPAMSFGLPRNLVSGKPGLNTGYATVECAMTALVMENRHLATPGSVDTIPGKGNVEDHVSNSTWATRKLAQILRNAEQVVACELLLSAQALSLVEGIADGYPIGSGSAAAMAAIREVIPACLDGDRLFALEMRQALDLVRSGRILDAVESVTGPLE